MKSFQESHKMPWPPTNKDLDSNNIGYPDLLSKFLSTIYSKDGKPNSDRCKRRINSTAKDICNNVTKGAWKMPKHILLGMSVRHLTGNSKLINFLNRCGHTVSHSFILEMETAICDGIQATTGSLPPSIMRDNNLVTNFCLDNFDLN